MTIACQTLNVPVKANITATTMTIGSNPCTAPCSTTVTITWTNTGGVAGSYEPAIIVNSARTGLGTNVTVAVNATHTEIFNLTSLVSGSYNCCPDPN